ncbi:efflux RND transporter periplasmic adaptor subunit [Acidobacteria bacterium AH-259-D05]|nr:efflux RND transporter periplasmic adaptor subunit [Acidobacteria bacterium AH-259-D05]
MLSYQPVKGTNSNKLVILLMSMSVTGVLEMDALSVAEVEALSESSPAQDVKTRPTGPENHLLAMGTVRYAANRIAHVRTPFPGTIVYRGRVPKIGDRVEVDQLLATIENRFNMHDYVHLFPQRWELLREVLQVKEAHVQAKIAYQRATDLLELGTISRREFERKESEFRQASAAVKKAEDSLSLHDRQIRQNDLKVTEVRSPIDGYITGAMYASGQMVYEGDPLFEIVDLSEVWLEAYIFPQDLNTVQNREHVTLRSTSFPNRRFHGRLISVRPNVEPESRTIRVLYAVENPGLRLRNGMLLDVYAEEEVRGQEPPPYSGQ